MKRKGWPKEGELAVIKIKRIMDYGAVADLIEYEDRDGFIHISNITKSWVKNIRSHVSTGETRVAEVTKVEQDKNTINLSLKDVSDSQKRRKIDTWKREKRTDKVIEKIAEELDQDPEESKEEIIPKFISAYGDAFTVFEETATYGEEVLEDLELDEEWKEKILEYSKENITPPEVSVETEITIETNQGNGVDIIRDSLTPIGEKEDHEVTYISAPRYKLKITEKDYKKAEKKLEDAQEEIKKELEDKGKVEFKRIDR